MAPISSSRWAVLVGIDHYDHAEYGNLGGCANDAVLVYNFLREELHVPKEQIFLHLAELPGDGLGASICEHPVLDATPEAVKESLDKIKHKVGGATNEAFLHVHFSGHGDSRKTIFGGGIARENLAWFNDSDLAKKPLDAKDELLCFPDNKAVTDVEFGLMLRKLANAGLTISATIDCCFAGGTDRSRCDTAFRCRSTGPNTTKAVSRDYRHDDEIENARLFRNATRRDSFLYKDQEEYNILMACQADQLAAEGMITESLPQKRYGVFTYSLVERLRALSRHRENITYRQFQGILSAVLHDKLRGKQIPAYFGPDVRILFDRREGLDSHELAYVRKGQTDGALVITRGLVTDARHGDEYRILDISSTNNETVPEGPVVKLTSVHDFESEFVFSGGEEYPSDLSKFLETKRIARLLKTAPVRVSLTSHDSEEARATSRLIRAQWANLPTKAFCLCPPSEPTTSQMDSDLCIHVGDSVLEVRDRNSNKPIDRVQPIPIDHGTMMKRLVAQLAVINKYHRFLKMNTGDKSPKPFEFSLIPVDAPSKPKENMGLCVASHCFKFTSKSTEALYFTLISLNPKYGIEKLYPRDTAPEFVAAGATIGGEIHNNAFLFDTYIAEELLPSFQIDKEIHDIWRIVVTTRFQNFGYWEQPNVDKEDENQKDKSSVRNSYGRGDDEGKPIAGWWIEDQRIKPAVTQANLRPKVKAPPNKFKVGHLVYDKRLQDQTEPFRVANMPRPGVYNLCHQHDSSAIENRIDRTSEFKEEHLRAAQ